MTLSNLIYKASVRHGIPADIYTAILMQESGYRMGALNEDCGWKSHKTYIENKKIICVAKDLGMSQIHYKTINAYGFDKERLMNDMEYSVNAGAKVLAWFHKVYAKREPIKWWTRYNCGTHPKVNRTTCNAYLKRVSRWIN